MTIQFTLRHVAFIFYALVFYLASSNASAAFQFERVASVHGSDFHIEQFTISEGQEYSLTLTDFAYPDELDNVGVSIVSAGSQIASIEFGNDPGFGGYQGVFGSSQIHDHSWGADFQQETTSFYLEAGTYLMSMSASFNNDWYFYSGMQYGLYSVEMIATPVPGALLLMGSGLGLFGWLSRKKKRLS